MFKTILPSIYNKSGNYLEENPDNEKDYVPFVINKALSFGLDTVLLANELNKHSLLSNKCQYNFLYHAISKGKRYVKWQKPEEIEDVEVVQKYYNCSEKKAKEYINMFKNNEIAIIKSRLGLDKVNENERPVPRNRD